MIDVSIFSSSIFNEDNFNTKVSINLIASNDDR